MPTNVLIVYYSAFNHVFELANAVADGAESVADVEVRLTRVAELEQARVGLSKSTHYIAAQERQAAVPIVTHDDLRWADAIAWGTPTRFGNMAAQMKLFMESLSPLWLKGELEGVPAGVFTSTSTIHGGQEITILSTMVPLLHLGMVFVGTPYGENPQILVTEGIGGSPYGPSTLAGPDNSREVRDVEKTTARNLGIRLAKMGGALKGLRRRGV